MLEPDEGKLSRPVLRRGDGSNSVSLAGEDVNLCVDRAVPIWGQPEDGNASDKTLNRALLSEAMERVQRVRHRDPGWIVFLPCQKYWPNGAAAPD